MPNKAITAIIAITIITVALIFTGAPSQTIYGALAAIAALGGVSIYKNSHPK